MSLQSVLNITAAYASVDRVQKILNSDPYPKLDIHQAFMQAVQTGRLSVVKYLYLRLESGHNMKSAIILAANNGRIAVVKFLCHKNPNMNLDYALSCAAYHGHLSVVRHLVSLGANILAENGQALRWAVERNHLETVKFLCEMGADNIFDAIDIAIRHNYWKMVDYLFPKLSIFYVTE